MEREQEAISAGSHNLRHPRVLPSATHQLTVYKGTMGRKGRRRSAAQIRHTENMKQRRRASPGQAEEIAEVYRCMTIEEYKRRMMTAEREVEKGLNDLKNAERRVR